MSAADDLRGLGDAQPLGGIADAAQGDVGQLRVVAHAFEAPVQAVIRARRRAVRGQVRLVEETQTLDGDPELGGPVNDLLTGQRCLGRSVRSALPFTA